MKKDTTITLVSIGVFLLGVLAYFKKKVIGVSGGAYNWSKDENFFFLPKINKSLIEIGKSVGITMSRNKGYGNSVNMSSYQSLKNKPTIYWAVYDVNNERMIAQSSNASKNVYAASVSKVVVTAAAFQNNGGTLPSTSDYGKAIKLLVKSDNGVWDALQSLAGGKDAVNKFSNDRGYKMNPARNGGNNINAVGMSLFWKDIIKNNINGSEAIFKISASCQTSGKRSRYCIPKSCFIGSKTGTYTKYAHDSGWIQEGENFYSITVLTDGSYPSETVGTMFGGLYNEYIKA